jgi:hypothetical protein
MEVEWNGVKTGRFFFTPTTKFTPPHITQESTLLTKCEQHGQCEQKTPHFDTVPLNFHFSGHGNSTKTWKFHFLRHGRTWPVRVVL